MRPVIVERENVLNFIRADKVVKLSELTTHFNCSESTIFRKFEGSEYITSYNKNGQFITLQDIAEFDKNGIWMFKGAYFSIHEGVRPTINCLVDESKAGLSAGEINDMLNIRANNQLRLCVNEGKIIRERFGRNQIYFSTDEEIMKKQRNEREEMISVIKKPTRPKYTNNKIIINILVAIIKHEETSPEKIVSILDSIGITVSEEAVQWVFEEFNLNFFL